jgi:hypothetical protein
MRRCSRAAPVSGIDLAIRACVSTAERLWVAISQFSVLVIRNQHLLDEQLRDFATQFGPVDVGRMAVRGVDCRYRSNESQPRELRRATTLEYKSSIEELS